MTDHQEPSPNDSPQPAATGTVPAPMTDDAREAAHQEPSDTMLARDAIGLLTEDHRKAEMLFAAFAKARLEDSVDAKFSIAKQVCGDLLIHMAIEEAIFYPRVRQALADDALTDEAEQEHDGAKELIKEIGDIEPADPMFDMKIEALEQRISEHVEKEETVVFPRMLVAAVDLVALGQELSRAKSDMRTRLGLPAG